VDAAYAAAIKAGGTDEGKPADRTYFASGYYAANVTDFDGNRLEFVHKAWNPNHSYRVVDSNRRQIKRRFADQRARSVPRYSTCERRKRAHSRQSSNF